MNRRIHWTARSAGVYISSISGAPVMRVVGRNRMRKSWIILAGVVLPIVLWGVALTGTPLYGRRIPLRNAPVSSIELSMASRREITASNLCAQVMQTMQKARDGGPVHLCPCMGTLTIHYADGTTNRFDFMPGHRFNRLDMVDISGHSGMYSISLGEMFRKLESVGLKETQ